MAMVDLDLSQYYSQIAKIYREINKKKEIKVDKEQRRGE